MMMMRLTKTSLLPKKVNLSTYVKKAQDLELKISSKLSTKLLDITAFQNELSNMNVRSLASARSQFKVAATSDDSVSFSKRVIFAYGSVSRRVSSVDLSTGFISACRAKIRYRLFFRIFQ